MCAYCETEVGATPPPRARLTPWLGLLVLLGAWAAATFTPGTRSADWTPPYSEATRLAAPQPNRDVEPPGYFAAAFQAGARVKTRWGEATVRVIEAGKLELPTGRIVACDSFVFNDVPFARSVPPGSYPVVLSAAVLDDGNTSIACACLRIRGSAPVRWRAVPHQGQRLLPGQLPEYPVGSASGCFMDQAVAQVLVDRIRTEAWTAWNQVKMRKFSENRHLYVDMPVEGTGANQISFGSGRDDGSYSTYFGFDSENRVLRLVTDFQVYTGTH